MEYTERQNVWRLPQHPTRKTGSEAVVHNFQILVVKGSILLCATILIVCSRLARQQSCIVELVRGVNDIVPF